MPPSVPDSDSESLRHDSVEDEVEDIDDAEESQSPFPAESSAWEEGDLSMAGDSGQPSPKRRRLDDGQGNGGDGRGEDWVAATFKVSANADADADANGQPEQDHGHETVPYLRPGLRDLDDKTETACIFRTCGSRTGATQQFIKHLMDRHGLIRGEHGRQVGGKRKSPKYLTLCPSDWPYNHWLSSSCSCCKTITGILSVLGDLAHESPAICSFCWTFFPSRGELVTHINEEYCRSYEGYPRKLTLVKDMYVASIRMAGVKEIAEAAADQRQAHIDAERAERAERLIKEAQMLRGQSQARLLAQAGALKQPAVQQQQQQPQPQPQQPPSLQQQPYQPSPPPPPVHPLYRPPPPPPAPLPLHPPSAAASAPPPPLTPTPQPPSQQQPGSDYAVVPSAALEPMARSIERLTNVISDLTAANVIGDLTTTNARLLRDLRLKEEQLAVRDERILTLSVEKTRLAAEVEKLTEQLRAQGGARVANGE